MIKTPCLNYRTSVTVRGRPAHQSHQWVPLALCLPPSHSVSLAVSCSLSLSVSVCVRDMQVDSMFVLPGSVSEEEEGDENDEEESSSQSEGDEEGESGSDTEGSEHSEG